MVRDAAIKDLLVFLAAVLLAWGWQVGSLGAQSQGVQLILNPKHISFTLFPARGKVTAAKETVTIQVVVPPHRPWRLTVMAQGPLQSGQGKTIPIEGVTWKGSPGSVFTNGTLSASRPQLLAQGQGPRVGTMRLFLKSSWDYTAGNYTQGLTFQLSSP